MATPRRKAPRKTLPQTIDEAVTLAVNYLETSASIEQMKADADQAIAQIQAARDAMILPLKQNVDQTFSDLRDWWAVAGPEMTKGKRKSIEIAGCLIGERTTPPALKHLGIRKEDLIAKLEEMTLGQFLRIKRDLDKPAILSALRLEDDVSALLTAIGMSAEQKDEFFIDRAVPKDANSEIIEERSAA